MKSFQNEILKLLNSFFVGCPHLNRTETSYIFGGNLCRSALAYKITDLLKINRQEILPCIALIELIHSVSLLQDDIIDQADTRRGFRTIHNASYSVKNTLFLTTYILTKGIFQILSQHPKQGIFLSYFSQSIQKVCLGEIMQDFFPNQSLSQSLTIAKKKTGELFALTFHLCSFAKNCSPIFCEIAQKIGMLYGLIFQIKDDLQDLFEDQMQTIIYKSFPILLLKTIGNKTPTSPTSQKILIKRKIVKIANQEKKTFTKEMANLSVEEKEKIQLLLSLVDEILHSL